MRKPRKKVPCPDCGEMTGNLFLHRRKHNGKRVATTPQPTKDRPFTELHLEELLNSRLQLDKQRDLLEEEIKRRLEELGLKEQENRVVGVPPHYTLKTAS